LQTSVEGVFAGGDAVSGPASAVEALAAGRKAAISIDRYIRGANLSVGREGEGPQQSDIEMDTEGVERKERIKVPTFPASERRASFGEVQSGFTQEQAIVEAKRCLSCADCCECLSCVEACEAEAVDHALEDGFEEVEVGAIVVATGYDLMAKEEVAEFGEDPDVLDGLQFERILSPSGPTDGVVKRPSDETIPKEVVFISCVGSRDPEHGFPYCSRVCCMYLVKMAMLYKHAVPDGQAYIFYMDQRTTGKGYEEFAQRAVEEDGVVYLRGRVSRLFRDGKKIVVWGADTLTGKRVEIASDLVVLGMAMIPNPRGRELIDRLRLTTNPHGFLTEAHAKLKPVETSVPGVFIAGTAQGPRDIPDTIAQASAAASRVLALFAQDHLIGKRAAGAW
jgi:heterodisulfide reductase subunit A